MNPRRGHESTFHLAAKIAIGRLFSDPEWSVFYEQRDTDILVMHHASQFVAGIETESTPRNVLRNISRDLSNGCHAVATVTLQKRFHGQIENRIRKQYPNALGSHLQVFPYGAPGLDQLVDWVNRLALSHAPYEAPDFINPKPKEK